LLKQITVPTLIYGGAFDHVTPARAMIEIAREIPGSFLFLDNYVGHDLRDKIKCFVAMTSKFFLGASQRELQEISYSPMCQNAPDDGMP
jgi:pimeloyl-ACP methyl ester carboxylesterase